MTRALVVLLALLVATPAFAFGTVGGGIGRIFIYGDSQNNGYGESPKPDGIELAELADSLGIPSSSLWVMGEGGVSVYEHALNSDNSKCVATSTEPWGLSRCRFGIHQVRRVSGTCRSFAPLLPSALTEDTSEEHQCTGSRNPIEACTGSGTGDMYPTCLADLPISGQDYFVMMFGTNDVYASPSASWCTQSQFDPNFQRDYEAMLDEFELYGMTGVVVMPPPNLESFAATNETNEKIEDCIRTFLMTTMKAAHPNHVYVDFYEIMRGFQTANGDDAFAALYDGCVTPLPCQSGDGIHLSEDGDRFYVGVVSDAIRELQRRRLGN